MPQHENTQTLPSHQDGPELGSLQAPVKFPTSNTDVSKSHACHTEQTSLEAVTTVTSEDLNTDAQPCVNSGRKSDGSHLNKTIMKEIGNTRATGRITSQSGTSKSLLQVLQTERADRP